MAMDGERCRLPSRRQMAGSSIMELNLSIKIPVKYRSEFRSCLIGCFLAGSKIPEKCKPGRLALFGMELNPDG